MTAYSLTEAPAGVANPEVWTRGVPGKVAAGDLWLLSWDGVGAGLGAISARMPGYVLVWPVTLPSEPSHSPALMLETSPLGVPVSIWPTRETGVGDAVLHRRLGHLLAPRLMVAIEDALDEDENPPLPFAHPASDPAQQRVQDEEMIDRWEAICLTQWPAPTATDPRLDREAASSHGLTPTRLSELLKVDASEAVALQLGEVSLAPGQAETIAADLGVAVTDLLTPTRATATAVLLDPAWKDHVLRLAAHRDISEASARDLVATEFALAARSSNSPADLLRAAFARLLGE